MAKEKGGKRALAPKIEERAEKLALPIIEQFGCRLWDVRFEKEGAMWYLRVLFDSDEGLDSDSCEEVSKPINELFDKQDFIEQVDILEIGTPGIYKKLRKPSHFKSCVDKRVTAQVKGEKGEEFITGILRGYDEEKDEIVIDEKILKLGKCLKVNLDEETDEYSQLDALDSESGETLPPEAEQEEKRDTNREN